MNYHWLYMEAFNVLLKKLSKRFGKYRCRMITGIINNCLIVWINTLMLQLQHMSRKTRTTLPFTETVNCDISPEKFNSHFINITKNLDSNFKNKPDTFLWKGPKNRYVFKSHHPSFQDIQFDLNSMTNRHWNDILGKGIQLLKITSPVISKSLAYVVNSSLDNGIVHEDWKKARVTPVYKNEGEINDQNNFRPISVISHMAILPKNFVSKQSIKYLENHAFISIDQSAYLKRHSTHTSLHRVINDWLEQINDNSLNGACLLDISKCFDSINYEIFL